MHSWTHEIETETETPKVLVVIFITISTTPSLKFAEHPKGPLPGISTTVFYDLKTPNFG
jgi:hypothetical protein